MNLTDKLKIALKNRKTLLSNQSCLRIFDASGDGVSNLVVDALGTILLVHDYSGDGLSKSDLQEICKPLDAENIWRSIYYWQRKPQPEAAEVYLLSGEASTEEVIDVDGIKLLIRPERAPNAGLFIDSAPLRQFILNEWKGKRVINTFAYTGSLGLAALFAGAEEVIQVDSNAAILGWARENYELNKDKVSGSMRFIEEDVISFLRRENRRIKSGKKPACDLIILDPPTIGHSQNGMFRVEHDLPKLIEVSIDMIKPGGCLSVTVNNSSFNFDDIEILLEKASGEVARSIEVVKKISPPEPEFSSDLAVSSVMRGIIVKVF